MSCKFSFLVLIISFLKEKLYTYLETLGWTVDKLRIKNKQIREQKNINMGDIRKYGCKFSYSEQLKEKPINILLPKKTYIELADIYQNIKNSQ